MRNQFSTVVIERNSLFREGLVGLLGSRSHNIAAAGATLADMNPQSWPEATVVILGDLGDSLTYAEYIADIRRACPTAKIVILGEPSDFAQVRAALNAGVSG